MEDNAINQICVIVGASHGGVNCAFALRREGWKGEIILFDGDPNLPYHRPPLSKGYLDKTTAIGGNPLKPESAYEKENILLSIGVLVTSINRNDKTVSLSNGKKQSYDRLVLATGGFPIIPPIIGAKQCSNVFTVRTLNDVIEIKNKISESPRKRIVIIGGGYIGLEVAASLKKMQCEVTILEREKSILSRVTSDIVSDYLANLHEKNGVAIHTSKNVTEIAIYDNFNEVVCDDGTRYAADAIIFGVGIGVNSALAENAGLDISNGIRVSETCKTSNPDIYAIGDCTNHFNKHYEKWVRLECVQNAVDQGKIAAASLCGKEVAYDSVPWFWSDQYDVKLQMVGLSEGHTEALIRKENDNPNSFSVWYFKGNELLAVDAVNNAKAYVLGMKFIKSRSIINKEKLTDSTISLKPAELIPATT